MIWHQPVGSASNVWLACGLVALMLVAAPCHAGALPLCGTDAPLNAADQDRLLRFSDIVRTALEASGEAIALISRSGLDLDRFGVRYSHAGIGLREGPQGRWKVRQLYYACDEQLPGLFDQGMAGFVLGSRQADSGRVAVVFVPPAQAESLQALALDNARALRLLGASYSANAYAFSTRYQNCNQWVAEMLASAWGGLAAPSLGSKEALRPMAQQWLQQQGYAPIRFRLHWAPTRWLAQAIPWLHNDDHPADALAQGVYAISMPASIEAFVKAHLPEARRMEFCHTATEAVVHEGWDPLGADCRPGPGDTVMALQDAPS